MPLLYLVQLLLTFFNVFLFIFKYSPLTYYWQMLHIFGAEVCVIITYLQEGFDRKEEQIDVEAQCCKSDRWDVVYSQLENLRGQ